MCIDLQAHQIHNTRLVVLFRPGHVGDVQKQGLVEELCGAEICRKNYYRKYAVNMKLTIRIFACGRSKSYFHHFRKGCCGARGNGQLVGVMVRR